MNMSISELKVRNIRSYDISSVTFSADTTLIIGPNGAGKTTLLEAIYLLLAGTSFRGRDRDMIAHNSTRGEAVLVDSTGSERRISLQITADDLIKKTFRLQEKTFARLPAKYRSPVVLFEPSELRAISSSPERRRHFFDGLISRLYPEYSTILARYQRILLQRNELLKQRETIDSKSFEDQLFTWDIKFSEMAETITGLRRNFIVTANQHLSKLYSKLAESEHTVTLSYQSSIASNDYRQKLLSRLSAERIADSYRGYTTAGPHRDDFRVSLDTHLANETASRGEMRSIMLAIKLLEVQLQSEITGTPPLILLDDVFSELDKSREAHLIQALKNYQTIITATDSRNLDITNTTVISLD